jgi:biotin transport system substrate-specific component
MKFKTIDLVLAALFAALMGISANLTAFITISGVPMTFQTIVAILAGALLGSSLGAISMIVYTIVGLVGVPVFAGFSGGFGVLTGNTFGFILSFIILAFVVGKIVEHTKQPKFGTFLLASIVGLAINYIVGTSYMYLSFNLWLNVHVSYKAAWIAMVPYLIKDAILTVVIAVVATRIYDSVKRFTKKSEQSAA